jgi:predicted XRE-type DNA-binding protein
MRGDWWRSKLTAEQVIDIRLLARSGQYWQREIAERFAITQSEVSLLMHRRRWRWLFYNNEGNEMTEDALKAELAALKKRQGELEAKLAEADKPPAPQFKPEPRERYDPTANFGMPRSVVREMAKAIPPDLARDLRADALKPNPVTGTSQAQLSQDRDGGRVQIQRGTGWQEPNPLSAPPGVPIMDRLMDMQDAIDKADLERRLARTKE